MMLVKLFKCFVIFMLTICLASCSTRSTNTQSKNKPAVPFKVFGAQDEHKEQLRKKIEGQGAEVITIGQNYLISIPSSLLFRNQSPRINWESYGLLNDVACYLKQFRKVSVSVSAFMGECVSPHRDTALTITRSREVANYLWSQDIESRFIFTQGLGSDKPIISMRLKGDQSLNSRVEITFHNEVA